MLESLQAAVSAHTGTFRCVEINRRQNTKVVHFRHLGAPPQAALCVPDVPGLQPFYQTFESLTLYVDDATGEAAYHIASPAQWADLDDDFRPWLDDLDDDERAEYLPNWIDECLVVGEIPHSGNYLLVPTSGPDAGKVVEFEHDGVEFLELGASLPDFVLKSLDLDATRLTAMASHLRFMTEGDDAQWWIEVLQDNRGNVVRTEV